MKPAEPFPLQPLLENERVRLRPLLRSDFDALYKVASDPLIWEQHPQADRHERSVFEVFFEDAIRSAGAFLIEDRDTGEVLGSSRFYGFSPEDSTVTIGYTFLGRKHWGGPVNRMVKHLMLTHAFPRVKTVLFNVGERNERSRRAVEKLGARLLRIEEARRMDGSPFRSVTYALTEADYVGNR